MFNPLLSLRTAGSAFGAVRRRHGVSLGSQLRLWREVRTVSGMSRREFHQYRLWRRELDPVARHRFASQDERRRTGRLVAPLAARAITHHKLETRARLHARGIATPAVLAVIDPGASHGTDVVRDARSLAALLSDPPANGLVLKADQGMQGSQVEVAARSDCSGLWRPDGSHLPIASLWQLIVGASADRWIVEPRLHRDPRLPAWAGDLISTLRMFTVHTGGIAHLHAATLKIPMTSAGTDNMSRGNLGAPVALDTGRLGSARTLDDPASHALHPVNAAPITGLCIPGWDAAVAVTLAAAEAVLPLRIVGWDVALTESGPVLLEGNVLSAEAVIQVPQDAGMLSGWYLELLREVGAEASLARRRTRPEWRTFETREREWCASQSGRGLD